jgi:hypothetical protein
MAADTTTRDQPIAKPKGRRRRKIVIILSVLLVFAVILGGLGYAASQMLLGPSEGTIVNSDPYARTRAAAPAVELEQFEGTYVTFAYPDSYTVQPPSKDNANSLETHTFVASGMMSKILTITVTKLPSGKLEDDASYYMRSLHPETYSLKPQMIQGDKVVLALDAKNSQQAAFWAHNTKDGGKLLTFTISSVSINSAETAQEYQKMLESIRWR